MQLHPDGARSSRFYVNYQINIKRWESITMTNTVSSLKNADSKSYQLIDKMAEWSKTTNL